MNDLKLFQQFALGKRNEENSDNNRCVIYTRVSTNDQEDNTSLGGQREECVRFCERNGYEIVAEFGHKGESAKVGAGRKEYERMIKFVRKKSNKIRYVVFYSYDRFSREGGKAIVDRDELRKLGIIIRSASLPIDTENPMGLAMEDFQLIFSKMDNDLRRTKTVDGMRRKLKEGQWCGQAPVGYVWDKNIKMIVPHPVRGPLIKKAFMMKYNDPNITSEEIRKELKALGWAVPKNTMSRMLRNPLYCGLIAHSLLKGEIAKGKHKAIISEKIFLSVNNLLAENNSHGWQVNEDEDNLPLKRFMRCSCCDVPLTGYIARKKGIWYYKCRTKGCGVNKNAQKMGEQFKKEILKYAIAPDLVEYIAQEVKVRIEEANEDAFTEAEMMQRRVMEIEKKLKMLKTRFVLEGEITREEYNEFALPLKAEKEKIEAKLKKTSKISSNLDDHIEQAVEICANLGVLWEKGGYRDKQRIQKMAFPEGMVYDKQKDEVRTSRVNSFFALSKTYGHLLRTKKEGRTATESSASRSVPGVGLEPTRV